MLLRIVKVRNLAVNSEGEFYRKLDDSGTGVGAENTAEVTRINDFSRLRVQSSSREFPDRIASAGVVEPIEEACTEFQAFVFV